MPTPEQRAATLLRYKEKNAEKIRERSRLWAQANKHKKDKAKVAAYNKQYAALNPRTKTPEQSSADQKRYYERHKERLRVKALERYHATAKHKIDRVALAEYNKAYRAANRDKLKRTPEENKAAQARFMDRYHNEPGFKEKYLSRQKQYIQANPLMIQKINLKKKYGMSLEEFDAMAVSQERKCAICRLGPTDNRKDKRSFLHVDHDHKTGRVRGLLCQKCNRGLGLYNDQANRLRSAADYLERT